MVINKALEKNKFRRVFFMALKNNWENRKMTSLMYHLDPIFYKIRCYIYWNQSIPSGINLVYRIKKNINIIVKLNHCIQIEYYNNTLSYPTTEEIMDNFSWPLIYFIQLHLPAFFYHNFNFVLDKYYIRIICNLILIK